MIIAEGITKSYGKLQVLKGVDFSIQPSEIVSIVGASGAGKTTLLQILGTLDKADKGVITYFGEKPSMLNDKSLSKFRNLNIGFIFQFHQLLPEFTALENVMIPGMIAGKNKTDLKKSAIQLLEELNLKDRIEHKPNALSGGEQQRVAVARALINSPKLILADEPSGNLDSKNAKELHDLFLELRDRTKQAFIIVTHNEDLAKMADRRLVMVDGKFEA